MAPLTKRATPVLWLFGPPGVGKSTVGWEIYRRLAARGIACAYVDIDQLGICYPEPYSDPGRYRLKERNLGAVVTNFAATGARGVVVSGVVDPVNGVDVAGLAGLDVTLYRLRADRGALRQRVLSRRGSSARVDDVIAEAVTLDGWRRADAVLDTTSLTVEQTVERVLQASRWAPAGEPRQPVTRPRDRPLSSAGGRVVWLCGPNCVGKSTIGFVLYRRLLQAGLAAGYVDIDQIGFCAVAPDDHWLRACNLAAVWQNYRSAGAEALVVAGPVHDADVASVYETVLPRVSFAWFRLHAGPSELAGRVRTRQQGGSWPQPGDPLRGASPDQLQQAVADAAAQADELERVGAGARVNTDGLDVEESASVILRQVETAAGDV